MKTEAVQKAIKIVGSQGALAAKVSEIMAIDPPLKQQAVSGWLKKGCPANRVLAIEKATIEAPGDDVVTRHELDIDLYPFEAKATA